MTINECAPNVVALTYLAHLDVNGYLDAALDLGPVTRLKKVGALISV